MKDPTRRYGNPEELLQYTQGIPLKQIAEDLHRDERTIRDWLSGARKIPFWVPELVKYRRNAVYDQLRDMGLVNLPRAPLVVIGQPAPSAAASIEHQAKKAVARRASERAETGTR